MRITDLISLCFENLRRRKGRTALTVIGVMVGTCAIVVMVSLGIAMNVDHMYLTTQLRPAPDVLRQPAEHGVMPHPRVLWIQRTVVLVGEVSPVYYNS